MPMIQGSVTIDPTTGAAVPIGAAGEVFAVLDAGSNYGSLQSTNPAAYAAAREQLAVMARAIAVLIPHIQTNGVINTTVAPGIAVATAGTAAAQVGATTAPGTGIGTIA